VLPSDECFYLFARWLIAGRHNWLVVQRHLVAGDRSFQL
jgi:hypothetical protein